MAIVYRTTDRLKLKVKDLVFTLSPLNRYQKARIQDMIVDDKMTEAACESIRCSIKSISGVQTLDGSEYGLEFNENGELIDSCVDDLFNLDVSPELSQICVSLLNGIPKVFTHPLTGKKLKDVEYVKSGKSSEKKAQD